jgi:hypothetical protein
MEHLHNTSHINIHLYIAYTCGLGIWKKEEVVEVKMALWISSVINLTIKKLHTPIFAHFLKRVWVI